MSNQNENESESESESESEKIMQSLNTLGEWMDKLSDEANKPVKHNPIPVSPFDVVNHLADKFFDFTIMVRRQKEKIECLSELFEKLETYKDPKEVVRHAFSLLGKYMYASDMVLYALEEGQYVAMEEAFVGVLNQPLNNEIVEFIFADGNEVQRFNHIDENNDLFQYYKDPEGEIDRANFLFVRVKGSGKIFCFFQSPGSRGFDQADVEFCKSMLKQLKLLIKNLLLIKEDIRLEEELKIAGLVQQKLLPKKLPHISNLDIATFYKSAAETGGDWHGFVQMKDSLYVFVGDVTGHGAPAAIITATVYGAYQVLTNKMEKGEIVSTDEILNYLNAVVCASGQGEFLMTFYALRINLNTGAMEFSNAGHPLPFHLRSDQKSVKHLYAANSPLGHEESVVYDRHEGQLLRGDILILYTDGLVENENGDGDILSANKLHRFIKKYYAQYDDQVSSTSLLQEILDQVDGNVVLPIEDDLTVVCIRQTEAWPNR
ncbi:PP2C family protein-serine/threonine phosphatase [Deltaproteobacteria bacterium TL4]